jgi:hypothetical protein
MDMKVTVKLGDMPTSRNEGTVIAVTGTAENGDRSPSRATIGR